MDFIVAVEPDERCHASPGLTHNDLYLLAEWVMRICDVEGVMRLL